MLDQLGVQRGRLAEVKKTEVVFSRPHNARKQRSGQGRPHWHLPPGKEDADDQVEIFWTTSRSEED